MRVATGAGKIREGTKTPAARGSLFALLFNFDIDDASLKLEHQLWLDQNAVPFLTRSKRATIHLKGTASRTGSSQYNEKLSKKRVEAIQAYLVTKGVPAARIQLTWVGELEAEVKGTKDNTESDEDRAVAVLVRRTTRSTHKWVRVDPTQKLDGFDPNAGPPWAMVPARPGKKELRLLSGGGLRLRTTNPAVVQLVDPVTNQPANEILVPDDDEVIELLGGIPGEAAILAIDVDGFSDASLQVSVLPKKTASVAFYYVEDGAKPAAHKTTRKPGDEKAFMQEVNRVFNRQANVFFTTKAAAPLKVKEDWGNPASYATLGSDFRELRKHGDKSARIRTFCVWNYDADATGGDTDAEVDAIGGICVIFEDNAGKDLGLTMAHEFGHNLGLPHRESTKKNLMWPFTDQRGGHLDRDQILLVNKKV